MDVRKKCAQCDVVLSSNVDEVIHYSTLGHHAKLDQAGMASAGHYCKICEVLSGNLAEYSKHVQTDGHKRRRDRLTAIEDVQDTDRNNTYVVPNSRVFVSPPMPPPRDFRRGGPNRDDYANWPMQIPPRPPYRPPPHRDQHHTSYYNQGPSGVYRNGPHDYDRFRFPRMNPDRSSCRGPPGLQLPVRQERSEPRSRSAEGPREQEPPSVEPLSPEGDGDAPPLKRGILERMSHRLKKKKPNSKAREESPNVEKEKKKKQVFKNQKESSGQPTNSNDTQENPKASTSRMESPPKKIRIGPNPLTLVDKKSLLDKRALKLRAASAETQSQRDLLDRLNKYTRAADIVTSPHRVEEVSEAESFLPSKSRTSPNPQQPLHSALTSRIWGTGSEVNLPGAKDLPSNRQQPAQQSLDSTYASVASLADPHQPMSTPHHMNNALQAYKRNSANMSIENLGSSSLVENSGGNSMRNSRICSSSLDSLNVEGRGNTRVSDLNMTVAPSPPSLALPPDGSSTMIANKRVTVKQEVLDVPDDDNSTTNCSTTADSGSTAAIPVDKGRIQEEMFALVEEEEQLSRMVQEYQQRLFWIHHRKQQLLSLNRTGTASPALPPPPNMLGAGPAFGQGGNGNR